MSDGAKIETALSNYKQGDYRKTRKILEQFEPRLGEMSWDDTTKACMLFTLGCSLYHLGQYDRAADTMHRALRNHTKEWSSADRAIAVLCIAICKERVSGGLLAHVKEHDKRTLKDEFSRLTRHLDERRNRLIDDLAVISVLYLQKIRK